MQNCEKVIEQKWFKLKSMNATVEYGLKWLKQVYDQKLLDPELLNTQTKPFMSNNDSHITPLIYCYKSRLSKIA